MFTKEQINEILAVCEKSPLGPWKYEREEQSSGAESGLKLVFETVVDANGVRILRSHDKWLAQFIALARTALPQLAEELIKLRAVAEAGKISLRHCLPEPNEDEECVVCDGYPDACPQCEAGKLREALITLTIAGYGGEE